MELSSKQIREQIEDAESLPMLLLEANEYLRLFAREHSPKLRLQERLAEITLDYRRSRTYWQTQEELVYGAKVAWCNSSRCIGRIFWQLAQLVTQTRSVCAWRSLNSLHNRRQLPLLQAGHQSVLIPPNSKIVGLLGGFRCILTTKARSTELLILRSPTDRLSDFEAIATHSI